MQRPAIKLILVFSDGPIDVCPLPGWDLFLNIKVVNIYKADEPSDYASDQLALFNGVPCVLAVWGCECKEKDYKEIKERVIKELWNNEELHTEMQIQRNSIFELHK